MNEISKLLEEFDKYEVKPSEKQIELGNKIKAIFEDVLKEIGKEFKIEIHERPCLKIDLEDENDYPVVSVIIADGEIWVLQAHIYPSDYKTIDGELTIQLDSDNDEKDFNEIELEKVRETALNYLKENV